LTAKASTLRSSIEDFIRRQGISAEMEQNLVKEAVHLHLLSAMSDAGILRHAVFQGGTALRLCYGGERYSEDLDFVCGKSGSYFTDVELLAAERIRINLAEMGEGRHRRDIMGKVRRDEFRSRFVA
jgi:predicted nucleotidyltransferase component of viral defense system